MLCLKQRLGNSTTTTATFVYIYIYIYTSLCTHVSNNRLDTIIK